MFAVCASVRVRSLRSGLCVRACVFACVCGGVIVWSPMNFVLIVECFFVKQQFHNFVVSKRGCHLFGVNEEQIKLCRVAFCRRWRRGAGLGRHDLDMKRARDKRHAHPTHHHRTVPCLCVDISFSSRCQEQAHQGYPSQAARVMQCRQAVLRGWGLNDVGLILSSCISWRLSSGPPCPSRWSIEDAF